MNRQGSPRRCKRLVHAQPPHGGQTPSHVKGRQPVPLPEGNAVVQAQPLDGAAAAAGLRQTQPVSGLHRTHSHHPVCRARLRTDGKAFSFPAAQQSQPAVSPR